MEFGSREGYFSTKLGAIASMTVEMASRAKP
jgi:hypothetical protein